VESKERILGYLLSTKCIDNVLDLPLLPMIGGGYHALRRCESKVITRHVLLGDSAEALSISKHPGPGREDLGDDLVPFQ
jgi:hypothetical protein